MITEIKTVLDFKNAIGIETTNLVIIDFYASWCGPCKRISPKYEELSKNYLNVKFCKIDSDISALKEICNICNVNQLPTFCFFRGGQYITKMTGSREDELEKLIKQYDNSDTKSE